MFSFNILIISLGISLIFVPERDDAFLNILADSISFLFLFVFLFLLWLSLISCCWKSLFVILVGIDFGIGIISECGKNEASESEMSSESDINSVFGEISVFWDIIDWERIS